MGSIWLTGAGDADYVYRTSTTGAAGPVQSCAMLQVGGRHRSKVTA